MSKSEELRKREFYDLAVKCKQFLEDHGFLVPTDTMAGHMAIFIQRERDALISQQVEVVVSKDRDELRKKIETQLSNFSYGSRQCRNCGGAGFYSSSPYSAMCSSCSGMGVEKLNWHALDEITTAVDAFVSEVIGEDDDPAGHTNREILNHFESRIRLRAEQRLKAGL